MSKAQSADLRALSAAAELQPEDMALEAIRSAFAVGDVTWGPEEGFQDLLCDVYDLLRDEFGYDLCPLDVTTDLTRVLVCSWDEDGYWVAPLAVGADGEPTIGPREEWVSVGNGWVETNDKYAARVFAAKIAHAGVESPGLSVVDDESGRAVVHLSFSPEAIEEATAALVRGVRVDDSGEQPAEVRERLTARLEQFVTTLDLPTELQPREDIPEAHDSPDAPEVLTPSGDVEWEAVFVPEGKLTDDGRVMAPGSITWRDLPLTLMGMVETAAGHDGAQVCGRIDKIWRDEESGLIRASGVFDEGEFGQEIARMVTSKVVTGVSVDLAIHTYEVGPRSDYFDADGAWAPKGDAAPDRDMVDLLFDKQDEPTIFVVTEGVIGASTVCPFPAFADASIEVASSLVAGASPAVWTVTMQGGWRVVARYSAATHHVAGHPVAILPDATDGGFVASCLDLPGCVSQGETEDEALAHITEAIAALEDVEPAMTASAAGLAPVTPPTDWFLNPALDGPTALQIDDEGRVFGHAATWGTCHIGFADACVTAPRSITDYSFFHLGEVACEDGTRVACGKVTFDTGHAPNSFGRQATVAHYDNTGTVAMDVCVGEDDFGIWVAGALRPDVDAEAARTLRAAVLSGDWRNVDGNLELVALLAVNVPGFPIPRARALVSSGEDGQEVLALVAAGIPTDVPEVTARVREQLAAIAAKGLGRFDDLAAEAA